MSDNHPTDRIFRETLFPFEAQPPSRAWERLEPSLPQAPDHSLIGSASRIVLVFLLLLAPLVLDEGKYALLDHDFSDKESVECQSFSVGAPRGADEFVKDDSSPSAHQQTARESSLIRSISLTQIAAEAIVKREEDFSAQPVKGELQKLFRSFKYLVSPPSEREEVEVNAKLNDGLAPSMSPQVLALSPEKKLSFFVEVIPTFNLRHLWPEKGDYLVVEHTDRLPLSDVQRAGFQLQGGIRWEFAKGWKAVVGLQAQSMNLPVNYRIAPPAKYQHAGNNLQLGVALAPIETAADIQNYRYESHSLSVMAGLHREWNAHRAQVLLLREMGAVRNQLSQVDGLTNYQLRRAVWEFQAQHALRLCQLGKTAIEVGPMFRYSIQPQRFEYAPMHVQRYAFGVVLGCHWD